MPSDVKAPIHGSIDDRPDTKGPRSSEGCSGRVRPRWQFSLKALFVLILVVAAYFAGRASRQPELDEARRQQERNFNLARKAVDDLLTHAAEQLGE